MRGEETQLSGAQALHASMDTGKQLVCMPGTHTKWVSLNGSVVQEFLTAPTGELFAMLCEHSVLVRDPTTPIEHHPRDFERGLAESASSGSLVAPPTFPEPQPSPGQAAFGRGRGIVDVGAAHRHRCQRRPVAVLKHDAGAGLRDRRSETQRVVCAGARSQRTHVSRSMAPRPRSRAWASCIANRSEQNHEPRTRPFQSWSPSCADSRPRARPKSVPRWWAADSGPLKCRSTPRILRHHQATGAGAWRHLPDRRGHGAHPGRSR